MQPVVPTLRILDFDEALVFYVRALGFHVDWEYRPDPAQPGFAQVSRDGLGLYLTERAEDCELGGLAYVYVPDVDAWYDELREKGIEVEQPPTNQPWGNRELTLRDPFGNRLRIASVLPSRS